MSPLQVVTIAASNYWPQIRVLAVSLRRHDPDARVHVLLIDADDCAPRQDQADGIVLHTLAPLELPERQHLAAQFTVTELCTAVKARFLRYLFDSQRMDRLLFLDPDVMFFSSLRPVWDRFEQADILLTPHFTDPSEAESLEQELLYLRVGTFNLGFIGIRDTTNVRRFLDWWDERIMRHNNDDPEHGVFTDQQWVNLVPGMFRRVEILEHPGLNVAYSNLRGRRLTRKGDAFLVNGQPLVFFHYHKFRANTAPATYFRGHLDAATAHRLFTCYAEALEQQGALVSRSTNGIPFFGPLADGQPFPTVLRRAGRRMGPEVAKISFTAVRTSDELGQCLVRHPLAAPYVRCLAYYEHRRAELGSAEHTLERYCASWWTRLRINTWFYICGPKAIRFPVRWIEPNRWRRALRFSVGTVWRGISRFSRRLTKVRG
jgi:hypothetical protein